FSKGYSYTSKDGKSINGAVIAAGDQIRTLNQTQDIISEVKETSPRKK
ncbi:MAG: hypothetical protein ACI9XJ_001427, partial [Marivirga sp.]